MPLPCSLILGLALLAPAAASPETPAAADAEAVRLYDTGQYAQARPLLEALDRAGRADGAMLYRLAFTLRAAGDRAGEAAVLERAIAKLTGEVGTGRGLEPAFYLSNAYRNSGRNDASREAAARATDAVEKGVLASPTDPAERFRLGKLYQDQGRAGDAARWYALAAQGLDPARLPAYARWSGRYLAEAAFSAARWAETEEALRRLRDAGLAEQADLDRLAVALAKQGRWADAAEAWRAAEQADRVNADRARYASRLAALAAELGTLPPKAPDGRAWGAQSREELEGILSKHAAAVADSKEAARRGPAADAAGRERLAQAIAAAKTGLVAAGLEYTLRDFPIREAAFRDGWAILLFQPTEWELPPGLEPGAAPPTDGRPDLPAGGP